MKLIKTLLLVFTLCLSAAAEDVTPQSFAYGFALDKGALQQDKPYIFTVPSHVYEVATKPGLQDVMIYNAAGEPIPFAVIPQQARSYREIPAESIPFFTISRQKDNVSYIGELILDISGLNRLPDRLALEFDGGYLFNTTVNLSVSTGDLSSWQSYRYGQSVARLQADNGTVMQHQTIDMTGFSLSVKYIKLESPDRELLKHIPKIRAEYRPLPIYDNVEKIIISGTYVAGDDSKAVFRLPGYYPVEWLTFNMPQSYLFPEFTIKVRDNHTADWQILTRRRSLQDYSVLPGIKGISANYARHIHWMLEAPANMPSNGVDTTFYWRADDVVFLARGAGPFIMVYGSGAHTNGTAPDTVRALEMMAPTAQRLAGPFEPFLVSGDQALEPAKLESEKKGISGQTVFIAVLVLAVLVISSAALRLLIDMNRKKNQK